MHSRHVLLHLTAVVLLSAVVLLHSGQESKAAETIAVPNGSVTINDDGSFKGSTAEVAQFPGFPDESESASFSGVISASGEIAGSYTSVSVYNVNNGGVVTSTSSSASGAILGKINPDGSYSVSWTGVGFGSKSGVEASLAGKFGLAVPPPSQPDKPNTRSDNKNSDYVIDQIEGVKDDYAKDKILEWLKKLPVKGWRNALGRAFGRVLSNPVLKQAEPFLDAEFAGDIKNAMDASKRAGQQGCSSVNCKKALEAIDF